MDVGTPLLLNWLRSSAPLVRGVSPLRRGLVCRGRGGTEGARGWRRPLQKSFASLKGLICRRGETLGDVRAVSHSKGACHRRHFRLRGGMEDGRFHFFFATVCCRGAFGGRFRLHMVADAWHFAFDITLNMRVEGIIPAALRSPT